MANEKVQLAEELHRPARRIYPRRKVHVRGLDETWQADLVDMRSYAKINNGHHYILTIIDIFSKYGWTVAIKTKSAIDVSKAMESVLIQGRVPEKLQVDNGKEFYNGTFKALMRKYGIHMYSTFSNLKASICERFNRTIKEKMWKQFSLQGNHKWLHILPDLILEYNNTKHRTIKMKPIEVTKDNEWQILLNSYRHFQTFTSKVKFHVGDKVRISKRRHAFTKGYLPNWTTEIFTVIRVQKTNPVTYILKDTEGQLIQGCFYAEELSKAKYPDVFLIDKIIRRCGDRVLIKWLGFDDSFNSWENINNVI